jgi:hypothetical protein
MPSTRSAILSRAACGLAAAVIVFPAAPAPARGEPRHATGPRGGSASAANGSWSARGANGQTRSGTYGTTSSGTHYATGAQGGYAAAGNGAWSAKSANGRSNSGSYGTTANGTHYATGSYGGAMATNNGAWAGSRNGQYAYGTRYGGGSGTYYGGGGAVHPPAVVNSYYGAGCYNCGGWSGGAVAAAGVAGVAAGAAIGAAAAANARSAYVIGDTYAMLPAGCILISSGPAPAYSCSGTWFTPYYGANGTYYRVTPAPY